MPNFSYKARRRNGEVVEGVIEATDRAAALLQIQRMGLFPVRVDAPRGVTVPGAPSHGLAANVAGVLPPVLRQLVFRQRRPKLQELATFTQQLANLLHCGMPLTVALGSMSHLDSKGISSEVSKQLKQDVTEGKSLSDAMARQPHVFSDLFVNMVRAGEQAGALEDVLQRLAAHYERFAEVQSKFVSALIYPALVLTVGVVIVVFFMTVMLPKFMEIFKGVNIELPTSTKILVAASEFCSNPVNLMIIGAVMVVGMIIFMRFRASPAGRKMLDRWKINAPVLGRIMRLNLFGQFARTLATLLRNGVPVLTALKITEQVLPNVVVREAIAQTREAVTDGKTIAQPLARSRIFPQLMIDLIKIGEDTGDVPGSLENLADTYERELNVALRVMTNLIEPVMIICIALAVGFLLLSVLSAMFKLTGTIGADR
jgi:type IV pilus assembly protein PilC